MDYKRALTMCNKMAFERSVVIKHHDELRLEPPPAFGFLKDTLRFLALEEAPNSHLPCVELVKSNQIGIEEIIEKYIHVNVGKFLLRRSVAPSFMKGNELNIVVDDPDGQFACSIVFSNNSFTIPQSGIPQKCSLTSLPVGSIIALMNPWLTMNTTNIMGLCCQNSAHFVILGGHHPLLRNNSITWRKSLPYPSQVVVSHDKLEPREAGVKYFAEKNYAMALECFSQALTNSSSKLDSETMAKQYANRAQTLLCLGKPEQALLDAERGLEIEPKSVKLMFRFARSLFLLKRYDECHAFLKRHGPEVVAVPELNALLSESQVATLEAKSGKYDLLKMHFESKKSLFLEGHADYFDSRLEVRPVAGFGRGIVANQDIAAGALLIAEKAFAFWPSNYVKGPLGGEPRFPDTKSGNDEVLSISCAKLSINPELREKLLDLFDPNDGRDSLKVLNQDGDPVYYDFGRIRRILGANGFLSSDTMSSHFVGCGLWVNPTYINHTCVDANCNRNFIGNFMFVFATRKIKKGEQLMFSYCLGLDLYKDRKKHCSERGFVCNCRLCQVDRADPPEVQKKMKKILEKFKIYPHFSSIKGSEMCKSMQKRAVEELRGLLEEARQLRPDRSMNLLAQQIGCTLAVTMLEGKKLNSESVRLMEEAAKVYEELGMLAPCSDCAYPLGVLHPNPARAHYWTRKVYSITKLTQGDERLLENMMEEVCGKRPNNNSSYKT